ncbi:MAG: hypothetical protein ACRDE2_05505 [Chitinophagaceae bacterium]
MSVNKTILKELEEIVPGFKWPENHPDFKVPEGYFQQFPGTVLNRINDETEEELPVALNNKNPYQAPEGYFENLPEKVLIKIKGEKEEYSIVRLPRRNRKWQNWAAAAVIAVFVAIGGLIWLTSPHSQNGSQMPVSFSRQLASVNDQAIEQYLGTQINSSNLNEVYNNLSDQDLQDALTNGLTTSAIEEYLQSNDPDSLSF